MSDLESKTIDNTEICSCGRVFNSFDPDDYDTLGSDSGVCCPDCGNEKFTAVSQLQAENARLKEKIKVVCVGINPPDFEATKKDMAKGIMPLDKPDIIFYCGWEMAILECGEILSKP